MVRFGFVLLAVSCALAAEQTAFAQLGAPTVPPPDYTTGTTSVLVTSLDQLPDATPAPSTKNGANASPTNRAAGSQAAAKAGRKFDPNVQQATATQPIDSPSLTTSSGDAPDAASVANSMAAADLLAHSLEAPKQTPLAGTPLSLLQALGPFGTNRAGQLAVARAYWKLSAAEGDYNWAVEEADELDKIPAGQSAVERTELATAHASTQARVLEAKLAVVTAQQELADLLGMPAAASLPLAADSPLVGAYRTVFDAIYAGRQAPPRMRLIDRTLPLRREAIETHVATVQAAASAVHAADEAHARSQTDLNNLLYCEAELSRQRRSFLVAVRDYNLDIAEYALTVTEPNVPVERVIGMLIRVKPPATPSAAASPLGAPNTPAAGTGATGTGVPPAGSPAGPSAVRPPADNPLMQPAAPRNPTQPPISSGIPPANQPPGSSQPPFSSSIPPTNGGSTPNGAVVTPSQNAPDIKPPN